MCFLPQLHNTGNVSRGKDASDVVEVTDKQAAIRSTGQGHWSQQFVAISLAITAGAGDTASAPITHDGADHWRLLGDEDVLTVAFVQDACRTGRVGFVGEQLHSISSWNRIWKDEEAKLKMYSMT